MRRLGQVERMHPQTALGQLYYSFSFKGGGNRLKTSHQFSNLGKSMVVSTSSCGPHEYVHIPAEAVAA
jgi:hypothetical protein